MHARIFLVTISILTLAGCGDATGSGGGDPQGSFAFAFERQGTSNYGSPSGSFSAAGEFDAEQDLYHATEPVAFALRFADPETGETKLTLFASAPRDNGRRDRVIVGFAQGDVRQPATFTMEWDRCYGASTPPASDCALVDIHLNDEGNHSEHLRDESYVLMEQGEVVVTSVTSSRIRGTLSGTGQDWLGGSEYSVDGGEFDVPILDEDETGVSLSVQPAMDRTPLR
jgi:hypothetical protein